MFYLAVKLDPSRPDPYDASHLAFRGGKLMSRFVLALSVALALVPSLSAANNWPPPDGDTVNLKDPANWPNDPGYGGQWNYWSFIGAAATSVRPGETASGISVDRAW